MARIGYLQAEQILTDGGAGEAAYRDVGAAAPTDVIDRATGDTRYVQWDQAAAPSYTAPAISNPPTQAEVQAIANALSALITSLQTTHTLT